MSDSNEPKAASGAIVVVDPDPTSRSMAEDLEDDLNSQVVAIDSTDFDPESSEEVLEASAYVVCFDLGIRSGLDLVEEIRGNPQIADKTILVASEAPTKELVCWAIAVGADGVCCLPYDGKEVGHRLAAAKADAQEAA